ncbi:hypothetical protein [Streptomyces sp. NPDC002990]
MRIRAAVTTATFVAALVLGGATAAVAYGDDDQPHGGAVHYGACGMSAGVVEGNPLFNGACEAGSLDWH